MRRILTRAPYNDFMRIFDHRGKQIPEATIKLPKEEITELLIAASQIDDGTTDHKLLRDPSGNNLAIYLDTGEKTPIQRQTDWWVGPLILILVVILVIGVYTIARSLINFLF